VRVEPPKKIEIKSAENTPTEGSPIQQIRSESQNSSPVVEKVIPSSSPSSLQPPKKIESKSVETSPVAAKSSSEKQSPAVSAIPGFGTRGAKSMVVKRNPSPESSPSGNEKCVECGKTVYFSERLAADGVIFHKSCFRCIHCKSILKLGSYAALDGNYYCKPHFKQLFAAKGNYNEGFGKEKLTHEWAKREGVDMSNLIPGNVDSTITSSSTPDIAD